MAKAKTGDARDERFFTQLLGDTQWAVYDFARGVVGDAEAARDIVQDVFVDTWRALTRHVEPFSGAAMSDTDIRRWLFHVAYCRAVSILRRRRMIAWEPLGDDDALEQDLAHEPEPLEDRVAEAEVLREALLSLGPSDAACLLLSAVHGYTSAEIAVIVDISPDAAKKRLSRAKRRLRAAYLAQSAQSESAQPESAQSQERARP
ncbi:MAG TPA: sigma-70 family RNA polymerase sigma factor [Ktedonobacterales bacterium]|nr:sigma-70 family RNA polymerase sigma factor [Ktedonobacterales bacterium]